MLKIFKSIIKGNLDTETYARDTNHRVTMGYDADTQTIKVKVEKVLPPNPDLSEDLPEDTPTVLREPHTSADFVLATERDFTPQDFVRTSDNCKWIVEYNSTTNTISDPIEVYEIAKQYINGSDSHEKIYYNLNNYRYQPADSLSPLFVLDSFYKSAEGFSGSAICFFVEDFASDIMDTILEIPAEQVQTVEPKEYEFWVQYNIRPAIGFEILDADGKIVASPLQSVAQEARSSTTATIQAVSPRDETGVSAGIVGPNLGAGASGNRFKVQLPVSDSYSIRVLSGSRYWKQTGANATATFITETVNGIANKTRLSLPNYTPDQVEETSVANQEFITQHPNHPISGQNASFSGTEYVTVRADGLRSGDFIKLKLNCGLFLSYAELWIEIQ